MTSAQIAELALGLGVAVAVGVLARLLLARRESRHEMRPQRAKLPAEPEDRPQALEKREDDDLDDLRLELDLFATRDEPLAWPSAEEAPSRAARYANVVPVADAPETPIPSVAIDVDIGALRPDSVVADATPFPDVLPREDLWLDVMLSSAELSVAGDPGELGTGHTVERRLLLPADGGPALTEDKEAHLRFWLSLPEHDRPARARLSYLYRDTVVQSQRIDVHPDRRLEAVTDFTLSERLGADLEAIADRPRVNVIANANSPTTHELTVRLPGGAGQSTPFTVEHAQFAKAVSDLRDALDAQAPPKRKRSRGNLIASLQALAPLGWELYAALDEDVFRAVEEARASGGDPVLQVVLPKGSSFTLPWNWLYDIALDSSADVRKLELCPLVEHWDEGSPLVEPGTRSCPHGGETGHVEGVLCPFGFWGYRYSLELLTSAESPKSKIEAGPAPRIVVAQTEHGINTQQLAQHVSAIDTRFKAIGATVEEARSKPDVRKALSQDLPFVYFLCHGVYDAKKKATLLSVGKSERISPADVTGWVRSAWRSEKRVIWSLPQPLVFVNACSSLAIRPEDLVDYLDSFVRKAGAVGLIGTEAKVQQQVAEEVAEEFFDGLLTNGTTVDDALSRIKTSFLADGNLVGLYYTPYCLADLQVVR